MNENKNMVSEDLSKAGEASGITPLLMDLDKLRIVSTSDIQDEEFLFNIKGKPCIPRKDLTVITGQAKTGKTMLISILMACCARRQEQGGRSIMGYPDFEKAAMKEAGIQRQNYFRKIFAIAEGQRVVRKTNDRCGRVVVMLIPL